MAQRRKPKKQRTIWRKRLYRITLCCRILVALLLIVPILWVGSYRWHIGHPTPTTFWFSKGPHYHPLPLQKIPPMMAEATIAHYDPRFYHHHGFDTNQHRPTLTAWVTHQVFFPDSSIRLFHWWHLYFTFWVDLLWDKRLQLTLFLNTVKFGPQVIGVAQASQHAFSLPVQDLSHSRCALLVKWMQEGLPNSPQKLDAFRRAQRDSILHEWQLWRTSDWAKRSPGP